MQGSPQTKRGRGMRAKPVLFGLRASQSRNVIRFLRWPGNYDLSEEVRCYPLSTTYFIYGAYSAVCFSRNFWWSTDSNTLAALMYTVK